MARHETQAAALLTGLGVQSFAPVVVQRKQPRPLFSRYIFAKFDRSTHIIPVEQTFGIISAVRFAGLPAAIPDEQIEALMQAVVSGVVIEPLDEYRPRIGETVKIRSGVFAGHAGQVIRYRGRDRLILNVDLLQRSVMVELDNNDIDRALQPCFV